MSDWQKSNWAGNISFGAARFHQPQTVAQVQEIVRRAGKVRVIGSRHCFNAIADTSGDLLWLGQLDNTAVIDRECRTATVPAGATYETLCPQLHEAGFALPNLASLKHISVVGASMTATHGSGNALGNLATVVSRLEMVTATGDVIELSRDRDGETFNGAVVALGALGVVTKVTLDLEPTFLVQQDNYEKLPFREVYAHFDDITSAGYSVSLFPTWRHDWVDTVWVKQRVPDLAPVAAPENLFGAALASAKPSGEPPPDRILTPFGRPGVWHERLPHYAFHEARRVGNELQSEYFVPRQHAVAAIRAVAGLRAELGPILGLSEIRTIRRDQLWLSSAYDQDKVGIHFNWLKNEEGVRTFLPTLERALAPFGARPHLGKLFALSPGQLATAYPRWADFRALVRKFDPTGKFSNPFLEKYVLGNHGG
jgi:xylitol oxidase